MCSRNTPPAASPRCLFNRPNPFITMLVHTNKRKPLLDLTLFMHPLLRMTGEDRVYRALQRDISCRCKLRWMWSWSRCRILIHLITQRQNTRMPMMRSLPGHTPINRSMEFCQDKKGCCNLSRHIHLPSPWHRMTPRSAALHLPILNYL
jgi:hypothetical protein